MSALFQALFAGNPELITFDLDGTLVDSLPDLAWATDEMLKQLGRKPVGILNVRQWVGNGVEMLVRRALSKDGSDAQANKISDTLLANAMTCFLQNYQNCNGKQSRLYPGVLETLDVIKCNNIPMVLVTNKPTSFTEVLLSKVELKNYFEFVLCGDTLANKKPHPEPLLYAAARSKAVPQQCLMVGDSKSDVEASRASFFKVVCVSYGYNHGEPIGLSKPDYLINSITELLEN